ncbi:hypothetical protein B0T16DRAFT_35429 [Cercophora newfieldiana]|uniref:Secreted protein n=1 Tax=Cercophora newfieldiana TaxID=92897 RepID=A0AA39YS16_9PEZI|nr:hypothetical protein B0T16DRAFT_35429 [Cercophora newfieldiana]
MARWMMFSFLGWLRHALAGVFEQACIWGRGLFLVWLWPLVTGHCADDLLQRIPASIPMVHLISHPAGLPIVLDSGLEILSSVQRRIPRARLWYIWSAGQGFFGLGKLHKTTGSVARGNMEERKAILDIHLRSCCSHYGQDHHLLRGR